MNLESAIAKLRETIQLKHLAPKTEESYVAWIARYSRFISERCRDGSPEVKMESFLTQLAKQGVSAGTNVRAIQEVMGHKHLDTTQGYLHAETATVRSPLDLPSAIFHLP